MPNVNTEIDLVAAPDLRIRVSDIKPNFKTIVDRTIETVLLIKNIFILLF